MDFKNVFWYCAGLLTLAFLALRSAFLGYTRPRPFSTDETRRSAEYSLDVACRMLDWLHAYRPDASMHGSHVLELGPGPDLCLATLLVSAGTERYVAFDAHPLANATPHAVYAELLQAVERRSLFHRFDRQRLTEEVAAARDGTSRRVAYRVDPSFDPASLTDVRPDFIISQAAFEHFSDVPGVLRALTALARPGTVLIAEIDVQTHSRWVRERDPLNIYRFSDRVYRGFRYAGQPNRIRPLQYRTLLAESGWNDVRTLPTEVLPHARLADVRRTLAEPFRSPDADMATLAFALMATFDDTHENPSRQ